MSGSVSLGRRCAGTIVVLAIAIGAMAFASLAVGAPVRGAKVTPTASLNDETCSSGAHTLSHFGDHVYPEMGNGGYTSIHTDVNLVYDAVENNFLAGTNVVLTDLATECLSDFSLDFASQTPDNEEGPGANMQVQKVFVNGEEAAFEFVQPTYPGDPNGQNDPDPAAHQTGQDTPVSATNPLPPACTPEESSAAANGQPCPARKLVIKPTAPLPSGQNFEVKVEYTGHPGAYTDGGGEADGWFRSDSPAGDGAFVTTEPVGTEAWMPLNNHPSAKPTYDFTEKVTKGRTVVANGELVKPASGEFAEENPPDEQFPEGSTTWRWHSPEPIANYLVENSIGNYDLSEREGAGGITYYEVQGSSITPAQKEANKAVMDQQEDITHFQERFNGSFPLTTDGVVVGVPKASFEEEMQGKITFNGGKISLNTFNHENMHQWWGDNVSESNFNETFFKEGMARLSEYLLTARTAATAAGGLDTPAGEAAFDASLVARFHTNYVKTGTMWTRAPSNPTPATLFSTPTTYDRPATAYIALRQILGKGNFVSAMKQVQQEFGGGSIHESQLEAAFREMMPNQSPPCRSRLNLFFSEWFDTEFPGGGSADAIRPQLTGPGLDPSASGTTFYNADGTCKRVGPPPPETSVVIVPVPTGEGNKVVGPAAITLTAKDPNSGIAKTEFKLDAGAFQAYNGPFLVSALGTHTLQFRSTNRDGSVEATKQVTFTIVAHDAPVTAALVSPEPDPVEGKVVGPATVTLAATENGGGVAKTEFSVDGGAFQEYTGPFTVSGFAAHTVEFHSTNRDDVVEATKQVGFTVVPHAAPTTTASVLPGPVDGKVTGPARVVLAAKDNGGGVASTEVNVDGGGFQPYDGPFTVSAFGDHTVEFRSTNGDGVVEVANQVAFTVVQHTAPITTASIVPNPVEGKVTGPATVVLSAKSDGIDVARTEFKLDGGAFQPYDGPFTVSAFGDHTVEFRSTNSDGAVEVAKQVAFTVAPHAAPTTTASILPDPVGGKVTGPATVVLAAKDNGGGIAGTEFKLDAGAFQPYNGPITVSALGNHTIEFHSSNNDGVVETAKQIAFSVVAPVVPPAPGPVCAKPHLTVAVSHPLRRSGGAVTLRPGKAYRYTGSLTCRLFDTVVPAPEGTVVTVSSVVGTHTVHQPGVVVGPNGKINTLMQFSNKRTVVFGFAADGFSAEARIRISVARR